MLSIFITLKLIMHGNSKSHAYIASGSRIYINNGLTMRLRDLHDLESLQDLGCGVPSAVRALPSPGGTLKSVDLVGRKQHSNWP